MKAAWRLAKSEAWGSDDEEEEETTFAAKARRRAHRDAQGAFALPDPEAELPSTTNDSALCWGARRRELAGQARPAVNFYDALIDGTATPPPALPVAAAAVTVTPPTPPTTMTTAALELPALPAIKTTVPEAAPAAHEETGATLTAPPLIKTTEKAKDGQPPASLPAAKAVAEPETPAASAEAKAPETPMAPAMPSIEAPAEAAEALVAAEAPASTVVGAPSAALEVLAAPEVLAAASEKLAPPEAPLTELGAALAVFAGGDPTAADWSAGVAAMAALERLDATQELEAALPWLGAALARQVLDRRSAVARQACRLLGTLSGAMGPRFDGVAAAVLPALLKASVQTVQVVADAADATARALVVAHREPSMAAVLADALADGGERSALLRARCAAHLLALLEAWAPADWAPHAGAIEAALLRGAEDNLTATREAARAAVCAYCRGAGTAAGEALLGRFEDASLRAKLVAELEAYRPGALLQAGRVSAAAASGFGSAAAARHGVVTGPRASADASAALARAQERAEQRAAAIATAREKAAAAAAAAESAATPAGTAEEEEDRASASTAAASAVATPAVESPEEAPAAPLTAAVAAAVAVPVSLPPSTAAAALQTLSTNDEEVVSTATTAVTPPPIKDPAPREPQSEQVVAAAVENEPTTATTMAPVSPVPKTPVARIVAKSKAEAKAVLLTRRAAKAKPATAAVPAAKVTKGAGGPLKALLRAVRLLPAA